MKIERWQIYIICSYLLLIFYFTIGEYFSIKFYVLSWIEDRYVEWSQFYILIFTSALSFILVKFIYSKDKLVSYSYILFGLFCFFVAMEEISWGQRIIGFESPQFFLEHNTQRETELHNILGNYLSNLIYYPYLLGFFAILYGVVLPFIVFVSRSRKSQTIFHRFNLLIPPKILIIGFLAGAYFIFYSKLIPILLDKQAKWFFYEEWGEFFIYLSLFYSLLIKLHGQKQIKTNNKKQVSLFRTIVKFSMLILCISIFSTLVSDLSHGKSRSFLRHRAHVFATHGFYKEAVEQYEIALGIKSNDQDYNFMKNLDKAINKPPWGEQVSFEVFNIYEDSRVTLFEHPPSKITYKLTVPYNASLSFGIALNPEVWNADKGDGVIFEILAKDGKEERKLFSKYIDPKNKIEDRKWHDEVVGLSKYGGKEISLSFVTTPGFNNNNDFDWAGWGDPKLISNTKKF